MKIQSKQDVIRWLKRLREDHPLSRHTVRTVDTAKTVLVYTDQVIRERYTGMIEYLESEEVA